MRLLPSCCVSERNGFLVYSYCYGAQIKQMGHGFSSFLQGQPTAVSLGALDCSAKREYMKDHVCETRI